MMTDTRADDPALEEDRLPWLEAVEEDDEKEGPGAAKLIAFVVIGLVAIGLIVGGIFWMGNRERTPEGGEPEVIAAAEGDYKVKPSDPGGMKAEGRSSGSGSGSGSGCRRRSDGPARRLLFAGRRQQCLEEDVRPLHLSRSAHS
jgi:hypothetical protein